MIIPGPGLSLSARGRPPPCDLTQCHSPSAPCADLKILVILAIFVFIARHLVKGVRGWLRGWQGEWLRDWLHTDTTEFEPERGESAGKP